MTATLSGTTPLSKLPGFEKVLAIGMPETDAMLHRMVQTLFGVRIPREACCEEHDAPFTAFADAFFDREPVQVWLASRGFGGKSWLLGTLTAIEALCKGAQSTILGASAAQSHNVHEVLRASFAREIERVKLSSALAKEPTENQTVLLNGAWIRALTASQKSVRGPHPQRLRMDEIDEMDLSILNAALGQPMRKLRNGVWIPAHTILSSTHQYPDGTFTEILKQAAEKNWRVYKWCYKCNARSNFGWLGYSEVESKRTLVPRAMWEAEYDLQEPSYEGRSFTQEDLVAFFSGPKVADEPGKEYRFFKPREGRRYITGVDLARDKDWSVITTFDTTESPWQVVAYQRVQKVSYVDQVRRIMERTKLYPGVCVYDATGLGSVVTDLLDDNVYVKFVPFIFTSASKSALFSEYQSAVEQRAFVSPEIQFMYSEHRYCRGEDLFGTKASGHPPDSVVAPALAWSARGSHIEYYGPADDDDLTSDSYWAAADSDGGW